MLALAKKWDRFRSSWRELYQQVPCRLALPLHLHYSMRILSYLDAEEVALGGYETGPDQLNCHGVANRSELFAAKPFIDADVCCRMLMFFVSRYRCAYVSVYLHAFMYLIFSLPFVYTHTAGTC